MPQKPKLLVICEYYLPAFESGGAVRTLANMVERLGDEFDFYLITRDHDGSVEKTPYEGIKNGGWNQVGKAWVFYLSKDQIRARYLTKIINESGADAIYLNSFFGRLTILFLTLLRLRRITSTPIILAPEGEFSPGALTLNPLRKKLYIASAKTLLIEKEFAWKAASESEEAHIRRVFGTACDIRVAPNMPPSVIFPDFDPAAKVEKKTGEARMIFLSRFARKKNLNWLLNHLRSIKGGLSIDIWGTLGEPDYWQECQRIIATLPPNIRVVSKGPVPHENVSETLAKYDFFVLPTLGENFGHVFIEALASGLPLVISDRTPWRNLTEHGVGWDIPLEDPAAWRRVLETCISMREDEYRKMSARSRAFAAEWLSNPDIERSNIAMLNAALGRSIT